MKDLKYLMAYSVPLSVVVSFYFKGAASFTALAYVFLFIPLAESVIPIKHKELPVADMKERALNRFFDWLLYLNVPIVYAILGFGNFERILHSEVFLRVCLSQWHLPLSHPGFTPHSAVREECEPVTALAPCRSKCRVGPPGDSYLSRLAQRGSRSAFAARPSDR
jgi:hypothetical protein